MEFSVPKPAPISQQIWDMKYRLKGADASPVDKTIADTWHRVARALAAVEAEPELWEARFLEAMEDSASCPRGASSPAPAPGGASPCSTASSWAARARRHGGHLRQSQGGIALTLQQGGGIGYDFSTLRPQAARLVKLASAPMPRGR